MERDKRKMVSGILRFLFALFIMLIAYRAVQNGRYTPMKVGEMEMVWDNWKGDFIHKDGGLYKQIKKYYEKENAD